MAVLALQRQQAVHFHEMNQSIVATAICACDFGGTRFPPLERFGFKKYVFYTPNPNFFFLYTPSIIWYRFPSCFIMLYLTAIKP